MVSTKKDCILIEQAVLSWRIQRANFSNRIFRVIKQTWDSEQNKKIKYQIKVKLYTMDGNVFYCSNIEQSYVQHALKVVCVLQGSVLTLFKWDAKFAEHICRISSRFVKNY